MKRIMAFLPCYNEGENIGSLIDEWNHQRSALLNRGYELCVIGIDDCSKDDTRQVILSKSEQYDNVTLLPHEVNKGLCGGLNSAIASFLKRGEKGEFMVLMDGDNTHNPAYIHEMLNKIETGPDCVIASRYCADSAVVGVARHREFMSDMAKYYYSMMLHVPGVKDYTCGYRLYTYDIIEKLVEKFGTEPVQEKSFACMMELLYKLYIVGARFGEVGFELRYDNKKGASKMHVFKTMRKSLSTAVRLKLRYGMRRRPY